MCKGLLAIAKEVTKIDERQRNAEPEAQQGYHRGEGDRTRAMLPPYEEI